MGFGIDETFVELSILGIADKQGTVVCCFKAKFSRELCVKRLRWWCPFYLLHFYSRFSGVVKYLADTKFRENEPKGGGQHSLGPFFGSGLKDFFKVFFPGNLSLIPAAFRV